MNEEFYDINDLPISANAGWQEMHALLNEHLPNKRKMTGRKQLLNYVCTALLVTVFLFTFLNLDTGSYTFSGGHASQQNRGFNSPGNSGSQLNKNRPILNRTSVPGNFATFKRNNPRLHFIDKIVLPVRPGNTTNTVSSSAKIEDNTIEALKKQITEIIHAPAKKMSSIAILSKLKEDKEKSSTKSSWSLFTGIAVNASVGGIQGLQPYPVAEIRYNILPGFYMAAGLSAWSPSSGGTRGISKTTYLYDTVNNISLYNETTTYDRLRYADISLSLGINVTKNISVQGGIQMSLLLHKRTKKILSPYDFQMASISVPVSVPLSALPPNMEQEYDVAIRPIDYRFIAGIRYSLKRTMVGLTYQHSLQPVGRGSHATKNYNQTLALSVTLQLK